MGQRGRPRKAIDLKILSGERRRERLVGPSYPTGRPGRPAWLDAETAAVFDATATDMERLGLLTPADGPAITLFAVATVRFRNAAKAVAETGAIIPGARRPNERVLSREFSVMERSAKLLITLSDKLGLNPRARASMRPAPPPERDDLAVFLAEREKLGDDRGGA